ncbi:MAG TPA: hypothetical protein VF459_11470 [Caulobacteraceae bacterium]
MEDAETPATCAWCDKPTFVVIQTPNGKRAACADHYIGLQAVENERQRNLTDRSRHAMAMMNLAAEEMNMVTGINLGGKVAIPEPAPASNFNNITVTNSTIGVLSTAAVGQISAYVGHLPQGDAARSALAEITSTVANEPMDEGARKNLLDQIAVIAEQAATEPQKRKPAVIGPILTGITQAAGATEAVAGAWKVVEPIIKAHFGMP